MFKKIALVLGIFLLLFSAVEAAEPVSLKVKGIKGRPAAFDVDGTVYMEPSFLENGGVGKILWEKEKLYIIPDGLNSREKVEIPFRTVNHNHAPCYGYESYTGAYSWGVKPILASRSKSFFRIFFKYQVDFCRSIFIIRAVRIASLVENVRSF